MLGWIKYIIKTFDWSKERLNSYYFLFFQDLFESIGYKKKDRENIFTMAHSPNLQIFPGRWVIKLLVCGAAPLMPLPGQRMPFLKRQDDPADKSKVPLSPQAINNFLWVPMLCTTEAISIAFSHPLEIMTPRITLRARKLMCAPWKNPPHRCCMRLNQISDTLHLPVINEFD